MTEYCSRSDVQNRLTPSGIAFVADQDQSGTADESELLAYIDTAISYAGNQIDGYLSKGYVYRSGAGNAWLKDRAIDIAAAKAVEVGGGSVPPAIASARDYSIKLLEMVKDGQMRVPGLAELAPMNSRWISRTPKVRNPG